ncbi:hypothetical protein [Haloquadratum walsbyi]|uniref:Uncharacterized protein n=1 Tax=Haloquadratum walsbyi J07HQW2 TaxID=1238425 RepID=U1NB08_9EURY|nr:hypothetical protein [Haloquadratum walsbyi]ERG93803.1 MAG: hypothetical protein J07HQW2_00237 [Haloquadratum walsbyi J07HQW2]
MTAVSLSKERTETTHTTYYIDYWIVSAYATPVPRYKEVDDSFIYVVLTQDDSTTFDITTLESIAREALSEHNEILVADDIIDSVEIVIEINTTREEITNNHSHCGFPVNPSQLELYATVGGFIDKLERHR